MALLKASGVITVEMHVSHRLAVLTALKAIDIPKKESPVGLHLIRWSFKGSFTILFMDDHYQ